MKRRAFGIYATCASLQAGAQALVGVRAPARIAWISGARSDPRSAFPAALRQGLEELGRLEGRDYRIEGHLGDDSRERHDSLVTEMLRSAPDLIVTQGPVVFSVQRSGTTRPVVFAFSGNAVDAGLVASHAQPGRNLTGISMTALELVGKRMEAVAEAIPGLRKVALVSNPGHAGERGELAASTAAAAALGLDVEYIPFRGEAGLEPALATALRARCQAICVFPDAGMMGRSERFAEFATTNRMPAVSGWAEFARRGNLMSYGPSVQQVYRRLASYVDRVLRGARPSELPVELPTVVEHVINLRPARAMGLAIPRSALLRADEIIDQ
ncbi:MAG TPA: ABC transporter substrate-binding protein [Caldimonas sp.]|jgi:putative ABC transport system substrate-binding protein|nr:ABC transporter substrate-binding protein [Caldimonas sp.]HEX2542434.1 ABC transporter substrate-binding protein [Caldimonas sp.]